MRDAHGPWARRFPSVSLLVFAVLSGGIAGDCGGNAFAPHLFPLGAGRGTYIAAVRLSRWPTVVWRRAPYGYKCGDEAGERSFDTTDSAPAMPKCVVLEPESEISQSRASRVAWDRTVFYEAHVRGFTKLHPKVPEALRGTFDGMAE